MAKMGRPSKYSDALTNDICEQLANGKSMVQICKPKHMPNRMTVMRWLNDERHSTFAAEYARAREMQGDYMDDLILSTANACTTETATADRVKIGAYQWRASKLRPKIYGDKLDIDAKVDVTHDLDAATETLAAMLTARDARK